jgi:hypothetical protein
MSHLWVALVYTFKVRVQRRKLSAWKAVGWEEPKKGQVKVAKKESPEAGLLAENSLSLGVTKGR